MRSRTRAESPPAVGARHTLVIGGTGMLREATLELARRGRAISFVARTPARLEAVRTAAAGLPGAIHPIQADYLDTARLMSLLGDAIETRGPIDLALCWVHLTAPDAIPAIAERLASSSRDPVRLFHVTGTGSDDQPDDVREIETRVRRHDRILYRKVQLGFVVEGASRRWLTDREISRGTIEAIDADAPRFTVSVITPRAI
jgi:hypothetical protein